MDSGIYSIMNIKNNKMYIGQTKHISRRFKEHLLALKRGVHFNRILQNSYNVYGVENFKYVILERCTDDVLTERENYWIQYYGGINGGKLFNVQCPIEPAHFTTDIRVKISKSNRGKHYKSNNGMYGKHHTLYSKKLMSENRKGTPAWNKGIPWSEEMRQKFRESAKNSKTSGRHIVSEEFKQKLHNLYYDKDRPDLRKVPINTIQQLRQEYLQLRSFKLVAQLHPDMYYEKVRCLIKYGTTAQAPKQTYRDEDWTKTIK